MPRAGGDEEPVRGEPHHDPIVEDHPVETAEEPVAGLANLQAGDRIDIQSLEKDFGVRPLHVDLAERRYVDDPNPAPDRQRFAPARRLDRLAGARVGAGSEPLTHRLESGAELLVERMERRGPDRLEPTPERPASHRVEPHRLGRRPRARSADLRHRAAERLRRQRPGVGLGRATLLDPGADQGKTFHMLDMAHPGIDGPLQASHGGVAVSIDERPRFISVGRRNPPDSGRIGVNLRLDPRRGSGIDT